MILRDSAHLQEKDADFANRHGFSKHTPALPLYTRQDALDCLPLIKAKAQGATFEPIPGWRVSLRSLERTMDVSAIAGHFGGGGHPLASGAHVEGGEEEKQAFIKKVAELVSAAPQITPA